MKRIASAQNHYGVMGVKRGCRNVQGITKAYKVKARLVHPDKNKGASNAVEVFKSLQVGPLNG